MAEIFPICPMRNATVILYPDPILTTPAHRVETFDSELTDVAELIDAELRASTGLAVAAQQVGSTLSVFGYRNLGTGDETLFLVNPYIEFVGNTTWMYKEGCLSFPGKFWYISRPRDIEYTGQTLKGRKISGMATRLQARVFQHENDHLRGRLILDRISKHERKKVLAT